MFLGGKNTAVASFVESHGRDCCLCGRQLTALFDANYLFQAHHLCGSPRYPEAKAGENQQG